MSLYGPDDLAPQRTAVQSARTDLGVTLAALAAAARTAGVACGHKSRRPDLPAVYAAHRAVTRAEEALDLAELDLRTAAGEDA